LLRISWEKKEPAGIAQPAQPSGEQTMSYHRLLLRLKIAIRRLRIKIKLKITIERL
jgi:hypothetical protein